MTLPHTDVRLRGTRTTEGRHGDGSDPWASSKWLQFAPGRSLWALPCHRIRLNARASCRVPADRPDHPWPRGAKVLGGVRLGRVRGPDRVHLHRRGPPVDPDRRERRPGLGLAARRPLPLRPCVRHDRADRSPPDARRTSRANRPAPRRSAPAIALRRAPTAAPRPAGNLRFGPRRLAWRRDAGSALAGPPSDPQRSTDR